MPIQDKATLKSYFQTGDTPTQDNFADFIDSLCDDTGYSSAWNGSTDVAPSQNAVYDKLESLDSLVVHLAGTETITGAKTFSLSPIFSSGTASTVPYLDSSKNLVSSSVTPTELGYVSGVTSAIQTQINAKLATSSFTDAAVTGKVLTGYTSGAGTVAATDTILQAIQKLNGNIAGTLTSVSGTANRITSTGGTTPVIDISSSYAGQSSITTLGTIGTGIWQGTVINPAYGGTGVNNSSKTITLGGNLVTSGSFDLTLAVPQTTTYTLPNTANETLAGLGTSQTFSAVQTFGGSLAFASTFTLTGGAATNGSNLITYSSNSTVKVGDTITGTGIPSGTYIISIVSSTSAVLSKNATSTGSGRTFTITPFLTNVYVNPTLPSTANFLNTGFYVNPVFTDITSTYNRSLNVNLNATSGTAVEITSNSEFLLQLTGYNNPNTPSTYQFGIGQGTLITQGYLFIAYNNTALMTFQNSSTLTFKSGMEIRVGSGTTSGVLVGAGGGSNTNYTSIKFGYTTVNAGTTATSGTINTVGIGGLTNNDFAPTSGNAVLNSLLISPVLNQTSTASGTIRGIYYNPTTTSVLGSHYAFEAVSGMVKISDTTASNSTSSGALTVAGGVGIAKKMFIGDNINLSGNLQFAGGSRSITDANGNNLISFPATVSSAVNYFQVSNAATAGRVQLSALGTDSNIGMQLSPKGTGNIVITAATTNSITDSILTLTNTITTAGDSTFAHFNSAASSTSNRSVIRLVQANASSAATCNTYLWGKSITTTASSEVTSFGIDVMQAGSRKTVLTLNSTTNDILLIENSIAGESRVQFRNFATAANTNYSSHYFYLKNDAASSVAANKVTSRLSTITAGSEVSEYIIYGIDAGSQAAKLTIAGGATTLATFLSITDSTASSSISTGALIVSGGAGIASNIYLGGDLKLPTVGKGIYVKEGSNATMGTATLSSGTVTVSTTKVTASSRIYLSIQSLGTVTVPQAMGVTAVSAGTSFTITSADNTDTSIVSWIIIEPA